MGVPINEEEAESSWGKWHAVGDYRLPIGRRVTDSAKRGAKTGASLLMLATPGLWIPGMYLLSGRNSVSRKEAETYDPSLEIDKHKRVFVRYKDPKTGHLRRFAASPGILDSDNMPLHRALLETALDREPDVKRGILNNIDRKRQMEELAAAAHYDNSKTPVMAAMNFEALGSDMDRFFARVILASNKNLRERLDREGRTQLTPEELKEEKKNLKERLQTDPRARTVFMGGLVGNEEMVGYAERQSPDVPSKSTRLPSVGPLEAEYFGDPDVSAEAVKKGFAPGVHGRHITTPGVVLQNRTKDNMILIKNVTTPPKALNCTIKIPRIDENGNKIKSHDVVVIRNGEVAMAIQGEGGKSRIANMADIMEGLERPSKSRMRGAVRGHEGRSNMRGAVREPESRSRMRGATQIAEIAVEGVEPREVSGPPTTPNLVRNRSGGRSR